MEDWKDDKIILNGSVSYGEWVRAWNSREASLTQSPSNQGLFSQAILRWILPTVHHAFWKKSLQREQTPGLRKGYFSSNLSKKFIRLWRRELKLAEESTRKPRIGYLLFKIPQVKWTIIVGATFSSLQGILLTVGRPIVLRTIINAVEEGVDTSTGIGLVLLFGVVVLLEGWMGVLGRQMLSEELSAQFQVAYSGSVYHKLLKMNPNIKNDSKVSEIDLIGTDIIRSVENLRFVSSLPMALAGVIGGIIVLLLVLGGPSLVGLSVMGFILILNVIIGKIGHGIEKKNLMAAGKRLSILRNILQSIQTVKFFGWEDPYFQKVDDVRKNECKHIANYRIAHVTSIVTGRASPVLSAMTAIILFVYTGNPLTVADAYAIITVFSALRLGLIMIPLSVTALMAFHVSFRRLNDYLVLPERNAREFYPENSPIIASVQNCDFGWQKKIESTLNKVSFRDLEMVQIADSTILSDVNFEIKRGEIWAIVGGVGSGKTTLLSSLIQAIPPLNERGQLKTVKHIGYASQEAFIIFGTIKQNILLGRPYDHDRYMHAIAFSALMYDIKKFPHGSETAIGERGTTLSGGQQQRLAVARALYARPDLLVLDDPLSAVDPKVCSHMFKYAIRGFVKSKNSRSSCIVAMNQLDLLPHVDKVLYLEGGRVVQQGTYNELMNADDGNSPFHSFVENFNSDTDKSSSEDSEPSRSTKDDKLIEELYAEMELNSSFGVEFESTAPKQDDHEQDMLKAEKLNTGNVSTTVYWTYIKSMRVWFAALCLLICLGGYTCAVLTDYWIVVWVAAEEERSNANSTSTDTIKPTSFYAGIYAMFSVLFAVLILIASYLMCFGGVRASEVLHRRLLGKLLNSPMQWFESTASGRILSRFSTDFTIVDMLLSLMVDNFVQVFCQLLVLVVVIIAAVPLMAILITVAAIVFTIMIVANDRAVREVKRIQNNAMSPLISNVNEGITGRELILTMGIADFFEARHRLANDEYTRVTFCAGSLINWGYLYAHFISFIVSIVAAAMLVLFQEVVDQSLIGLALTYAFLFPYYCGMSVQIFVRLNTFFTSLERLLQYDDLPQEKNSPDDVHPPQGTWPCGGTIVFNDVELRYRPNLPVVLKGVNFKIEGGKSVGICGRTGAGKSSIIQALFRLVEVSSGSVTIDGVNTSSIGLRTLRSRLTIIPQDPQLAEGTLRSNLDPFDEYRDEELLRALEMVSLKNLDLNGLVEAGANNWSGGERQLLCFARAFLRQNRILIMDEPTAACDMNTDAVMQRMIKEEFIHKRGCTVLCVAHRLNTICEYDFVMVMDNGKVVEYDSPSVLLQDPHSHFRDMVEHLGDTAKEGIYEKLQVPQVARN